MDIMSGIANSSGKILNTAGVFAKVILYGLIGLGIVYVIVYYLKYKYPLHLFVKTGKGTRYIKDRGKKDRKTMTFVALKNKDIKFPYPKSEFEYQYKSKSCLAAFIQNDSATWLGISDNPHFIPADYDMQSKMINDLDATWNIIKKKGNFWDLYGQQILWVGSLGIFLIVIILILKRMDSIIEMGKSIAVAQASSGKQVVNMLLPLPFLLKRGKK